jgi:Flp pilus assembly protein TadB
MSDPTDKFADKSGDRSAEKSAAQRDDEATDREIEDLAKELADKLRSLKNRDELTDYAVSLLRESNEEADQKEYQQRTVARASKGDPFNPIAFGIPLLVIGVVLCATGILIGPGLGVIGIGVLMVLYGLVVSVFSRRTKRTE